MLANPYAIVDKVSFRSVLDSMSLMFLSLNSFCRRIGILRTGLAIATIVVIAAAPFADGSTHMHDWRLFPSVIAPTLMMMLVFTLPLDITMAFVFMSDASELEKERLQMIVRFETILLVLMILSWIPFMFLVLDFSLFS
jgi:hypothetical protein